MDERSSMKKIMGGALALLIAFAALLTGDTLILKRTYPEWDFQVRIPRIGHGRLVWYSEKDGLRYQLI